MKVSGVATLCKTCKNFQRAHGRMCIECGGALHYGLFSDEVMSVGMRRRKKSGLLRKYVYDEHGTVFKVLPATNDRKRRIFVGNRKSGQGERNASHYKKVGVIREIVLQMHKREVL